MILHGDCLEQMRLMPDNSVDCVVTDPPYGWRFMGKAWDAFDIDRMTKEPSKDEWHENKRIGHKRCGLDTGSQSAGTHDVTLKGNQAFQVFSEGWAKEALRVLKPGGHMLVFCGPRTYHRMASGLEDAGFEIRDQLQWLFGSGFPKSLDISKAIDKQAGAEHERPVIGKNPAYRPNEYDWVGGAGGKTPMRPEHKTGPATDAAKKWQGFGTALKPANEPICLARKPLEPKLTVASNVLKWGVGGLNIDGARIAGDLEQRTRHNGGSRKDSNIGALGINEAIYSAPPAQGRWPANVIFDEEAAQLLDEQSGVLKSGQLNAGHKQHQGFQGRYKTSGTITGNYGGDTGGASRFFYVAKASKSERNRGLDCIEIINISIGSWESADQKAQLQVDTAQSPPKVIAASGTLNKSVTEWNTLLFGNSTSDPSLASFKSTIKTVKTSTIESKTLSWLAHFNTSASIQDANLLEISGGNHADLAGSLSPSINIINVPTGSATSASPAQSNDLLQTKSGGVLKSTHPTVKPIKLMEYLIKLICPPGGVVLDPFAGSGSTLVAAKRLGFQFIGIEMNEEYVEIASKRIQNA